MSLITTGMPGQLDDDRKAIGFWMTVEGVSPVAPIRVFVTYQALAQIEPSRLQDRPAAIEIFNDNRAVIEAAASNKCEAKGVDDGEYDGQPLLMVRAHDLP
jgi:hypothetical protein